MTIFESRLADERDRLHTGAPPGKPERLWPARFIVRSKAEPMTTVLSRAREVLLVVNGASASDWPTLDEWRKRLPPWFVSTCRPEYTSAEIEEMKSRRQSQSWFERLRKSTKDLNEPWALGNWLYWFEEDQREWFWWDAAVLDQDTGVVAVLVEGWPFPWDALSWLLRASGADDVTPEERKRK